MVCELSGASGAKMLLSKLNIVYLVMPHLCPTIKTFSFQLCPTCAPPLNNYAPPCPTEKGPVPHFSLALARSCMPHLPHLIIYPPRLFIKKQQAVAAEAKRQAHESISQEIFEQDLVNNLVSVFARRSGIYLSIRSSLPCLAVMSRDIIRSWT
jgi:hypothetical protein